MAYASHQSQSRDKEFHADFRFGKHYGQETASNEGDIAILRPILLDWRYQPMHSLSIWRFINKYDDVTSARRIFDGLIVCQNGTR